MRKILLGVAIGFIIGITLGTNKDKWETLLDDIIGSGDSEVMDQIEDMKEKLPGN